MTRMDKDNGLLGLLGLARKAGKLALGEEDAAAAALGHKTKLLLVASDAAAGTAQRASRAAEAGNAQCFSVALTKAELGGAVGRASCAVLAFTDTGLAAAAISIIGGADGPTSIFLAGKLGQTGLLGPIAVAAYSYMSLAPIIQPPVMKLLTTEKERKIKMAQLRPVSKLERILFPIVVTIVVSLLLPTTAPLVGMLMLGNLFKESGVVRQLTETASNALMYIVVILLGTSVGATTSAEAFLNWNTIKIVFLGLAAFIFGTAAGVIFGKIMCVLTHGKVNPLIGSAGVSAVPMAARVSQKVGSEADPTNFLLMHAMGPNVAGVIGTAVAAGTFMAINGVF